jgi:hypothetical protein
MTKKLEEILNLPESKKIIKQEEQKAAPPAKPEAFLRDAAEFDKIAAALPQVNGLGSLADQELDDLAKRATDAYDDIMDLGMNVEARYSGRLFEVAASMLKNAIDAKAAKLDKKLKMVELQLKKQKLDQETNNDEGVTLNGDGYIVTDRKIEEYEINILLGSYAMKSFKEYLTEGKKVYEFKIKIAGDCPKDCSAKIKQALATYKVESCSGGKSLPIAEQYTDFPEQKNIPVTIFDVKLAYPATSQQVRASLSGNLNVAEGRIKVRNPLEEKELELNLEHGEKSGESLLTQDYDAGADGQKLVGETQKMKLLKDLAKNKYEPTEYKADKPKSESSQSPLGKVKNPDPRKGK